MKKILPFLILLFAMQSGFAQWSREWSVGYTHANPGGKMKLNIDQANGVAMDFYLIAPNEKFSFGADWNYSVYGFDQSLQEYMFPDGTTANMNIDVTNSFMNLMASGRYNLITGKKLTPYVGVKSGYSFFRTNLTILDPDDTDSCEPVDKDLLQKDGTGIYSVGGGITYDLSSVFKRLKNRSMFLNLSAFYTQGGAVNYMNTDGPTTHHAGTPPNRTSDVEAEFINVQTQIIHKHHVGYVYSSVAQMMDYRLTLTFRKGN
jgi:opacity protein-like surface antigen